MRVERSAPIVSSSVFPAAVGRCRGNDKRLEQKMNEHQDACRKGEEKKSVIAEHAWKEHHPIIWQDRHGQKIWVKEALHIHLTPEYQCFNRDVGKASLRI